MERISSKWYEELTSRALVQIRLFTTGLYVFLFLKILFLFPVASNIVAYHRYHPASLVKKVLVAPATIFIEYPIFFLVTSATIVIGLIFIKRTYFSNTLGFLVALSVIQASEPVTNGSDYVLELMLMLSIPLSSKPLVKSWAALQPSINGVAVFLIQVHIALIYLLSGFDKLLTESWRNGEVMNYIVELDYFVHPTVQSFHSPTGNLIISWFTILFELAFPFLIWFNFFRIPLLLIGIIFHLGIILFLNLPDFGVMMIICYAIFLNANSKRKELAL